MSIRIAPLLVLLALASAGLPAEAQARSRPPVVLVVLDELPTDALLGPDGRIDAGRFPRFAALAGDSTWYPNATTISDSTWRSVPAILDGKYPRKGTKWLKRDHRDNIFRFMSRRGYRLHSVEEVTSLCHAHGCSRLGRRGFAKLVREGRVDRFRRTIDSLGRGHGPAFTFHHLLLPHQPWVYLPSGQRHQLGSGDFELGLTWPPGFHDPFLTLHNEQRFLLQLGMVDRLVGELVDGLRSRHMYRRALVVVTADHGESFDVGLEDRRTATDRTVHEVAPVPMFVKAPGQTRGRVDPAYLRTIDVFPTIARLLGTKIGWRVDGHPASSRAVRRRRRVRMVKRQFAGILTVGAADIERRRDAERHRRFETFGSGSWSRLFRIGPHQELLDRPTGGLAVSRTTDSHAEVAGAEHFRSVAPGSGHVPASVGGVITGRQQVGRSLAVAVNSTVSAVGRSFKLSAQPGERFSMMIPPERLRAGSNTVELLEIRADGSLVALGGAP